MTSANYPPPAVAHRNRIIGEDGFPHSEIAGSKVAHTSPTLIAACHVLLRLYMPRHPRIALTSRLRAHTTNISAGQMPQTRQPPLGKALSGKCRLKSQPSYYDRCRSFRAEAPLEPTPSRHRFEKPIHNVKDACALRQRYSRYNTGDPLIFISRLVRGGAYRDRTDDLMLAKQPLSQLS